MKYNLKKTTKTTNHEGGVAYSLTPQTELYLFVCSALLADKFYEKESEQIDRLRKLILQVKPEFVAKLCIYARKEMHLRSISHVLVVELAHVHKGLAKKVIPKICERADDMTEILAYQLATYGKPIPNQIKKGLALAVKNFDEYQLAKYSRDTAVKIKDVIFLAHPKRTELTDKVVKDTLEVPYTWEVQLSEKGNKEEVWRELIVSGKLGYMALLRNLRNILQVTNDGKLIQHIAERIQDAEQVHRSKQLPFRFWSAYKQLQAVANPYVDMILNALAEACNHSAKNLKLHGACFIVADVSGSMQHPISEKSSIERIEIGLVMSGIAKQISEFSMAGVFGDIFMLKNYPKGSPFMPVINYREGEAGYSTNGYLAIRFLNEQNIKVDNILIFTDNQMWDSVNGGNHIQHEFSEYRKNVNPAVKLFCFDLAGYSTVQFPEGSVYLIGGWSEKVFEYIEASQSNAPIKDIENIEL